MKKIIIIYLLILTFSIANTINFGKEITFQRDNNNIFEFTFEQDGVFFVQVYFPKNNLLTLNINSEGLKFKKTYKFISPPGQTAVFLFKKGMPFQIRLLYEYNSSEKGVIWMNPSINEIKVDLKQKYEWIYDFKSTSLDPLDSFLTYSIDKVKRNAVLEFKYNNNLRIYDNQNIVAGNPLKIKHGTEEKTNITTYEIKKGESYKIIISTQSFRIKQAAREYINALPSFSFHFKCEKLKEPEFGKEISFDKKNNNAFETTFSEDGSLFIKISFDIYNLLDIIISSSIDSYTKTIEPPGLLTVIPFKKNENIEISLEYKSDSNKKGIIWMYPSTKEIKINLNQIYQLKYDFKRNCGHQITSYLIYSIENAEYNALLEFKYNNNLILDKNIKAGNPLEIRDENSYKTDITTYEINKGKSYKIHINTKIFNLKNNEYIHHLPNFSFNFIYLIKKPELGKEISFDANNSTAFKLIFPEDGGLFIRIDFGISNKVNLNISSSFYNFNEIINPPGLFHVIPFKSDEQILIKLLSLSPSNEKGIIWMYPSTKEIKVDLNQKYEFKYDFKEFYNHNKIYQLIYSIDKAEKDAILKFEYNNFIILKNYRANNPLKICHEEICTTSNTTYEIKKGESYKMFISTNLLDNGAEYIHYLPAFSFNFIEKIAENVTKKEEQEKKSVTKKEEQEKKRFLDFSKFSKMEIAFIILISIIIIGAIVFISILCCRKNRKSNNDIDNRAFNIPLENIEDN